MFYEPDCCLDLQGYVPTTTIVDVLNGV
ncbi:hypothetical protein sync_1648 [Synechococcus sp. CC9311]|nr:hypothetical protein sync_1648 [Synechococcus sp. CC9311]